MQCLGFICYGARTSGRRPSPGLGAARVPPRARIARPPRPHLCAHAPALANVATDASRRARASASRTRPSADSVSPTGNIHKSAANKARTSKIGCTASKDQTTTMSADELREKTGPYGARQRLLTKGSHCCPAGRPPAAPRRGGCPQLWSDGVAARALHAVAARRVRGRRGLHDLHAAPRS